MENNKWVRTLFNQVVACHTLMSKLPPIVAVVVLKVKVTQQCLTLCDPMNYIVHGILQARILKWVALPLLQGIFPNQGSNPGLPHCRWFLYQLSHQGSPRILELVAYPFSRGSSQSRNWTGFSCIAGRFFINWAIREALQPLDNCLSL